MDAMKALSVLAKIAGFDLASKANTETQKSAVQEALEKLCDMQKQASESDADKVFGQSTVSAQKKVDLIVHYLQKRYSRQVTKRMKLSGYSDAPMYALELSLVRTGFSDPAPYLTIVGCETENPLEVNEKFLERYWKNRERQRDFESGKEKPFMDTLEIYQREDIASSESELLLKAEIEGIL